MALNPAGKAFNERLHFFEDAVIHIFGGEQFLAKGDLFAT